MFLQIVVGLMLGYAVVSLLESLVHRVIYHSRTSNPSALGTIFTDQCTLPARLLLPWHRPSSMDLSSRFRDAIYQRTREGTA